MLLTLLSLCSLIYAVFGEGCHGNLDITNLQPTLGLTTEDVAWGGSNSKFVAAVYTDTAGWSAWRNLDNDNCDDRERGETDYYDDFNDITDEWKAVALYNCGTDGHTVDAVFYWNGNSHEKIDLFCGDVSDTLKDCYEGDQDPAQTGAYCYNNAQNQPYYDYLWLDQNDRQCHGAVIKLGQKLSDNSEFVGKSFNTHPSMPDCKTITAGLQPKNHNNFIDNHGEESVIITTSATSLFNEMGLLIGVIALLVCSNIIVITMMVRKRMSNQTVKYSKVDIDSC